jgi:dUTP pyrophosphatase
LKNGSQNIQIGELLKIFAAYIVRDNVMAETLKVLHVLRLKKFAQLPRKYSEEAAGFDLFSAYDYKLPPFTSKKVDTEIIISLPKGCYGRIAPRSGLAVKYNIDVLGGVVDGDYRGKIFVLLYNFGSSTFYIRRGDRIAQLICEKFESPIITEEVNCLPETKRGYGGFGSTGGTE